MLRPLKHISNWVLNTKEMYRKLPVEIWRRRKGNQPGEASPWRKKNSRWHLSSSQRDGSLTPEGAARYCSLPVDDAAATRRDGRSCCSLIAG